MVTDKVKDYVIATLKPHVNATENLNTFYFYSKFWVLKLKMVYSEPERVDIRSVFIKNNKNQSLACQEYRRKKKLSPIFFEK